METPSSERQLSRTSAFGSVNNAVKAGKGSATRVGGSRRQPLLDLTNDSPIAGLALDRDDEPETPTLNITRRYLRDPLQTPGTGESLLRHQVRSLLTKVEADTLKPASNLRSLCHLNGYIPSPSRLLAPTPLNTPDSAGVPNPFATGNYGLLSNESDQTIESRKNSLFNSTEERTPHPEVIDAVALNAASPEKPIPRTLMFDSTEETDVEASISSPSSVISSEDGQKLRNLEDDNVSEWSMQVNISSPCPEQGDDYAPGENDGDALADRFSEREDDEDDEEEDEQEEFAMEQQGMSADVIRKAFLATEEGCLSLVTKSWPIKPQLAAVGSCCLVGVVCGGVLYVSNVGDSRAVLGRLVKATGEIATMQLSMEHNAGIETVRQELQSLHRDDSHIVVLKHVVWRVKGIIQVQ